MRGVEGLSKGSDVVSTSREAVVSRSHVVFEAVQEAGRSIVESRVDYGSLARLAVPFLLGVALAEGVRRSEREAKIRRHEIETVYREEFSSDNIERVAREERMNLELRSK